VDGGVANFLMDNWDCLSGEPFEASSIVSVGSLPARVAMALSSREFPSVKELMVGFLSRVGIPIPSMLEDAKGLFHPMVSNNLVSINNRTFRVRHLLWASTGEVSWNSSSDPITVWEMSTS
jgi:hypothetical protein